MIGEYLDGLKPEPRLVPEDFAGRIAVKRFEALGDGLAEIVVILSHDLGPMSDPSAREGWVQRQQGKLERTLAAYQRSLQGVTWLHGDRFSLADICAGYALSYLDQVLAQIEWRRTYPGLAAYAERLAARPSFATTNPVSA